MKKRTMALLFASHCAVGVVGFGLGIYALPILTAPPAPDDAQVEATMAQALYSAEFRRDLQDSDALHWGEGRVSVGPNTISLMGKLAPGPDYKLYLSPTFVESESEFMRLKPTMVQVGDVKTFNNFLVSVPEGVDVSQHNSVIVWCESFGEFITSAKYQ